VNLYKGYVPTKDKKCLEKFKNRTDFKSLDEVKDLDEYAGILAENVILIDVDSAEQSEILMKMVEDLQLDCRVVDTSRGRHFLFKNGPVKQCFTHVKTVIGLEVDVKVGCKASYEVLKFGGENRFIEWDVDDPKKDYQEIPKWLLPIKHNVDFLTMKAGDGRNQALFNYILTLQADSFTVDETRDAIRKINKYVMKDPLSDEELEVILRDESFQKPVFYKDGKFLFDKFANYIRNICHVVKIGSQLHLYEDGVYVPGYHGIEKQMIQCIPGLRKTQRREVLEYMELICDEVKPASADYIAFRNGVLHLITDDSNATDEFLPFSADLVITNRIPWDYNPNAYDQLMDQTLNNLACQDPEIRALLEECAGYCFFRRNELGKAFILTGDKSNGKSTYLDMIKAMLGVNNIAALELKELGDRFSTSMLFGKLANVSDDISDDFLQGNQVSTFKKIVTGNRIKAENKGQDPFEFEPFIKIIASANDIPRMKDKTGALLRRLIIIPFNAKFDKTQPGFDPFIKYKLIEQAPIEYLIRLAVAGLKRVLETRGFTTSKVVDDQLSEYSTENNPIELFISEIELSEIENETTSDVYRLYTVFCSENQLQPMSNVVFTKQLCKRLDLKVQDARIGKKKTRIYIQGGKNK